MNDQPSVQMPQYQCHKTVWALKIAAIEALPNPDTTGQSAATSYGAVITPADKDFGKFEVDANFVMKHKPQAGGYYVQYADGYASYSPAKAFEEGYTAVDTTPETPAAGQTIEPEIHKAQHRQHLELNAIAALAHAVTENPAAAEEMGKAARKAIDALLGETGETR